MTYTGGPAAGGGNRDVGAATAPARRVACSAGNESARGAETSCDGGAAASLSDPDARAGWRRGGSGVVGRREGSDALCVSCGPRATGPVLQSTVCKHVARRSLLGAANYTAPIGPSFMTAPRMLW